MSVYNQEHRTTSLLESFNANLSVITPSKFNFFKILTRLETYISDTSQKLLKAVEGPGEPLKKRPKKKQYNFENIEFCTKQFENGKWDVTKFLEYVVQDNRKGLSALEANNSRYEGEDSEDEDEVNEQAAVENLYCFVCKIEISNVLFLPCRQVVVCSNCYLANIKDVNLCPDCGHYIEKTIEIVPRSKN